MNWLKLFGRRNLQTDRQTDGHGHYLLNLLCREGNISLLEVTCETHEMNRECKSDNDEDEM
jgi:hypothetical protein